MKEASNCLARTLRMWREQKGVKMEVAARELGVSTATWGHWETSRRFPSLNNLTNISQYTDIPICRLICISALGKCNECSEVE